MTVEDIKDAMSVASKEVIEKYIPQMSSLLVEVWEHGVNTGMDIGAQVIIDRATAYLKDHISIPYDGDVDENGQPLANDYVDFCKRRLDAAESFVKDFLTAIN